jgi:membrane protease YdiL (CAAX protease family)
VSSAVLAAVELNEFWSAIVVFGPVVIVGLAILGVWLKRTRFGTGALVLIPRRRLLMPPVMPLVVLVAWVITVYTVGTAAEKAGKACGLDDGAVTALQYSCLMVVYLGYIVFMGYLASQFFARGLRGFGLSLRHVGRDAWRAALTLLAVLPAVMLLMGLVAGIGWLIQGDNFKMEENAGLTALRENPQIWVRALVIMFAGVVVPCFEEMLFRGLFQSVIRNIIERPWVAIIVTSVLFAALHPPMHSPALFALSIGLGYSYEKSGSLVRAIFMHSFFNMASIAGTLAAGSQ